MKSWRRSEMTNIDRPGAHNRCRFSPSSHDGYDEKKFFEFRGNAPRLTRRYSKAKTPDFHPKASYFRPLSGGGSKSERCAAGRSGASAARPVGAQSSNQKECGASLDRKVPRVPWALIAFSFCIAFAVQ